MPTTLVNLRPHWKRQTPYCFSYLTTQQEDFHLPFPLNGSVNERLSQPANKKLPLVELPVYCSGLFCLEAALLTQPFTSKRRVFLPFVLWDGYGSAVACMCQIAILPNNPTKVSTIIMSNLLESEAQRGLGR